MLVPKLSLKWTILTIDSRKNADFKGFIALSSKMNSDWSPFFKTNSFNDKNVTHMWASLTFVLDPDKESRKELTQRERRKQWGDQEDRKEPCMRRVIKSYQTTFYESWKAIMCLTKKDLLTQERITQSMSLATYQNKERTSEDCSNKVQCKTVWEEMWGACHLPCMGDALDLIPSTEKKKTLFHIQVKENI